MTTHSEKLDLKQLLDKSDYVDNTEHIRKVKHSVLIRDDIRRMENLKTGSADIRKKHPEQFLETCQTECRFLFDNYTDIFNKLMKDELDLSIMTQLLTVLKMIEDGKIDQEKGSIMVGKVLKELYVDSALRRADNLDKEHEGEKVVHVEPKPISWSLFKATSL
jgi:hypothetical protein